MDDAVADTPAADTPAAALSVADTAVAASSVADTPAAGPTPVPDLDAIEADLDAVQAALDRLNDGTYWTDEVTGAALPEALLAATPTARTAAS